MMMASRQTLVNYMTPLGLAHIMGTDHHYGPAPWVNDLSTANWNPFYYHKADATGHRLRSHLDRQQRGVAVRGDGARQAREQDHHPRRLPALLPAGGVGRQARLVGAHGLGGAGLSLQRRRRRACRRCATPGRRSRGRIDAKRFKDVGDFLQIQHYEARWWRDACLTYFASVNKKTIPSGYAAPAHDLPTTRLSRRLARPTRRSPVAPGLHRESLARDHQLSAPTKRTNQRTEPNEQPPRIDQ